MEAIPKNHPDVIRPDMPQDVRNLLALADALEREHEDFEWDYSKVNLRVGCKTVGCALGMADHIGLLRHPSQPVGINYALDRTRCEEVFGIGGREFALTFCAPSTYGSDDFAAVTPAMVAARLRRIAAEKLENMRQGEAGACGEKCLASTV